MNPHPHPDPHPHQDFFLDPHPHFFDADPQHCSLQMGKISANQLTSSARRPLAKAAAVIWTRP
jgi:hypothetical protein